MAFPPRPTRRTAPPAALSWKRIWAPPPPSPGSAFRPTGDGGSGVDFRAYSAAAGTGYTPTSGVFTAGISTSPDARNNSHPYYAEFGRETAPSAQLAIQSEQTGETIPGSVGMAWR